MSWSHLNKYKSLSIFFRVRFTILAQSSSILNIGPQAKTKVCTRLSPTQAYAINLTTTIFSVANSPSYFRGKKLKGQSITLSKQYQGFVLERRHGILQSGISPGAGLPDKHPSVEPFKLGTMCTAGTFPHVFLWSHEAIANASSDPYPRSALEWLQFAEQVGRKCYHDNKHDHGY